MDAGYEVRLVHTGAVVQYDGLKHTDDEHDAFWLAHLMRLGILPTGYIYPKSKRGLRDLARQRMRLVQHRASHITSVHQLHVALRLTLEAPARLDAVQIAVDIDLEQRSSTASVESRRSAPNAPFG
jgi:hypothetical protein